MFWLNSCNHIIASLILVLPLIQFTQRKQFLKHVQPWLCQLTCVHQFPVTFQEMNHEFLFVIVFGWITLICLNEGLHLIVPRHPSFVLCHNNVCVLHWIHLAPANSCFDSTMSNRASILARGIYLCIVLFQRKYSTKTKICPLLFG